MLTIKNDRLTVSMLEPGEGTNSLERFDRSAYIYSVVLDGKFEFCSGEPEGLLDHRLTGGKGLVSEIKCDAAAEEAGVGGWFPKFGVGLLRNEQGGRFDFRTPYEMQPFEVEYSADGDEAVFETLPRECMGYALREKRRVKLEGNTLTISYQFTNEGEKPLELGEYVHNFMTIEHKPLGPDYRLQLAVKPMDDKRPFGDALAAGNGDSIRWAEYSKKPVMMMFTPEEFDSDAPFFWKLSHEQSPVWVMEECSFTPGRSVMWSIDHIISFEGYNTFSVPVGETVTYQRRWTFGR